MDQFIRLAPSHFDEALGYFGGNVAHAADEDNALGFELWEQDQEEVVKRTVAENSKAGVSLRKYVDKTTVKPSFSIVFHSVALHTTPFISGNAFFETQIINGVSQYHPMAHLLQASTLTLMRSITKRSDEAILQRKGMSFKNHAIYMDDSYNKQHLSTRNYFQIYSIHHIKFFK